MHGFLSVLVAVFSNKVWVLNGHYNGVADTYREIGSFFGARLLTLVRVRSLLICHQKQNVADIMFLSSASHRFL